MKGILLIGFLVTAFSCKSKLDTLREKPFDSLDEVDRHVLLFDSVYGDYIRWVGRNHAEVTWALYFDKSGRFAIKSFYNDTTGYFTKIPGNINVSGRWAEADGYYRLRFYYPHLDFFDSLKNDKILRVIDAETIDLAKDAPTIWIVRTECKRQIEK